MNFKKFFYVMMFVFFSSIVVNAQSWDQIGADIVGETEDDLSGWSLSLSADGSTVAIGALYNGDAGFHAGQVRIYENNSGVWTQIGANIDGEAAGDLSSLSVS